MKGRSTRLIAFVVAAAASMPVVSAQYQIVDLGTLGGSASVSLGINNRGDVVGGSTITGDLAFRAFVAQRRESDNDEKKQLVVRDLGAAFGGINSQALAINARGSIAGATIINGTIRAVLYTGTAKQIGTLGGLSSVARGLNNRGQVVGYSALVGNGQAHAFLFDRGKFADLGTLGGINSAANAINERGDVVGNSETSPSDDTTHGFVVYKHQAMQSLGTLGGRNSSAVAINNRGHIVGSADTASGTTRAYLFAAGAMHDLGTLGGDNSDAFGINDKGEIVGRSQFFTGDARMHAFRLDRCNRLSDLNSLIPDNSGWILAEARAINDAGKIVGTGQLNGQTHAFLLLPQERHDNDDHDNEENCAGKNHRAGGNGK